MSIAEVARPRYVDLKRDEVSVDALKDIVLSFPFDVKASLFRFTSTVPDAEGGVHLMWDSDTRQFSYSRSGSMSEAQAGLAVVQGKETTSPRSVMLSTSESS